MAQQPNILYLNSHDTGRVTGPMGYAVRTPRMSRLAAEGVLLRNCHCAGPTCSPSRAALITGMVPHSCGMLGLAHRGWALTDPTWTLPSHLQGHGYATAAWNMPANHCNRPDRHAGQKEAATAHGYADFLGNRLEDLVAWVGKPPTDQPWFLSASFTLTHRIGRGFTTPPDAAAYDPRWTLPPPVLADTAEVRADWAHFLADVTEWDRQIGLVLDALEASGQAENTIVIVTTDHGVPFPGLKCNPTVHGTGVLCILRGPGGLRGGLAIDHLVSQIDLFPTLCGIAGLPVPARVQGVDLRPALAGKAIRDQVTAEVTYHAAYEPVRTLRTDRHVYVRRFGDRRRPVTPNCDASPSRDLWLASGWPHYDLPDEELYDSVLDPQERRNLVADPQYAGVARELRARLDRWMAETDDPLLRGPVPLVPGAFTTSVDERDPDGPRKHYG